MEKDNNAEKNRGQQEKIKTHMRWTDSIKEAVGMNLQEPSRAVEDGTLCTSFIHRLTLGYMSTSYNTPAVSSVDLGWGARIW